MENFCHSRSLSVGHVDNKIKRDNTSSRIGQPEYQLSFPPQILRQERVIHLSICTLTFSGKKLQLGRLQLSLKKGGGFYYSSPRTPSTTFTAIELLMLAADGTDHGT